MKLSTLLTAFSPLIFLLFLGLSSVQAEVTYASPLSVNGEEFEIGNLLQWTTASEENSQHFFVEKSADGLSFEYLGQVEAAGSSDEEVLYRYMDIGVTEKEMYYRLRQVDQDGTERFSEPVGVLKEKKNQFMLVHFTDITVDKLFEVSLEAAEAGELFYALHSHDGNEVFNTSQMLKKGLHDFQFNLEGEPAGYYRVTFRMGQEVERLNIIKLEDEASKKNVASKKETSKG